MIPEEVIHYDNTPTVVCVIVRLGFEQVLLVRRNNEPGKGLLGLPGGYHMRGETWQQCGAREVFEETGWRIDPDELTLLSYATDEYGNNLVIAEVVGARPQSESDQAEVQELVIWSSHHFKDKVPPTEFAFPRHYAALHENFWGPDAQ